MPDCFHGVLVGFYDGGHYVFDRRLSIRHYGELLMLYTVAEAGHGKEMVFTWMGEN